MYEKSRSRGECSFVNGFFVVFSQKREPLIEKYQTKVKELPISLGEFVFRSRARIPATRLRLNKSRFANMVSRWTSQEAQSRDKQALKCRQAMPWYLRPPQGPWGIQRGERPLRGIRGRAPYIKIPNQSERTSYQLRRWCFPVSCTDTGKKVPYQGVPFREYGFPLDKPRGTVAG